MISTLLIFYTFSANWALTSFHEKAPNIYRINQTFIWGDNDPNQFASLSPRVAYAILGRCAWSEMRCACSSGGRLLITHAPVKPILKTFEQKISSQRILISFTFTFPLIKVIRKLRWRSPSGYPDRKLHLSSVQPMHSENFFRLCHHHPFPENRIHLQSYRHYQKTSRKTHHIQFEMLMSINTNPRVAKIKRANGSGQPWNLILLDERSTPEILQSTWPPPAQICRPVAGTCYRTIVWWLFKEERQEMGIIRSIAPYRHPASFLQIFIIAWATWAT